MACPFSNSSTDNGSDSSQRTLGINYSNYLMLNKILDAQAPISWNGEEGTKKVHEEHLFIIIHQTYELWFKQIIVEMDSVMSIMKEKVVDEAKKLCVVSRLHRINLILKVLNDQVVILETMTPLDFMEFRDYLLKASGFQSFQFRQIENKFGVKKDLRVRINQSDYIEVFDDKKVFEEVKKCEEELSLFQVIEKWLERTPGLEEDGFNFWAKFRHSLEQKMKDEEESIVKVADAEMKESLMSGLKKNKLMFDSLFDEKQHNALQARGERRFSHKAFQGALMISLYRDEPRFHQPHKILELLMDIDANITKWRYNHVLMVQRMIGSANIGTGGSSGYQYLRSTLSDRYKVFLDLFNLSTYLIPRDYLPPLTRKMKWRLSMMQPGNEDSIDLE